MILRGEPGLDPARGPSRDAQRAVGAIALGLAVLAAWGWVARIDISAMGQGQIVPSNRVQLVQNLEGGILEALLVKEGDKVTKNQPVARIQDVEFNAALSEARATDAGLTAEMARLKAEIEGTGMPRFPKNLMPELVAKETQLFVSRKETLAQTVSAMESELDRHENARRRAQDNLPLLRGSLRLAGEQRAIIAPQVKNGVVSQLELLTIDQRILEYRSKIQDAQREVAASTAAATETRHKIASERSKFRAEALARYTELGVKAAGLRETLKAHQDRLARRELRAPMNGVVKRVLISTIGSVARPGADVMEIVPSDDELVVEARFSPSDIAFIHEGQPAYIRITAYDASIYGAVPATVAQVSADSTVTERDEVYYLVRVRATEALKGADGQPLPLLPGMIAQVDVLTGKRRVLEYLLKPITRLQYTALHER